MIDPAPGAWSSWVLLFLGRELAHSVSQRVRWLWASHAVHHSSAELDLAAAYRLGWTARLSFTIACFSPLALLGFRPEQILEVDTATLLYQVWLHAAWMRPLGPLEGLLNTPSAHPGHHGTAPAYRDRNFGGVLVISLLEPHREPVPALTRARSVREVLHALFGPPDPVAPR